VVIYKLLEDLLLGAMVLTLALVFYHAIVAAAITIPLGGSMSLTGDFASIGQVMKRSIDLYNELVAAKAAQLAVSPPVNFTIAIHDDQSTADGVAAAYANMTQDGIEYFIGPFTSELTATALQTVITEAGSNHVLLAPSSGECLTQCLFP
jgi:ABC-type branched-subunit amino acid transport system substrate-binding protein